MDAAPRRGCDRRAFCCLLPSFRGLAHSEFAGLELPEARTSGSRTRRSCDPELAKAGLATYKKKPEEADVISFFWTKAALCSSPWSVVLGHHVGRLQSSTVGIEEIGFLRYRLAMFARVFSKTISVPPFKKYYSSEADSGVAK